MPRRYAELERALGTRFRDPGLLEAALTHRSFAFEQGLRITNERLEFLGDAVLGFVVADLAYQAFPDLAEGELARIRAATVNTQVLADVARSLPLGEQLLLGRGEEQSGGRGKASILADGMEALLGAVYLDRGYRAVFRIVERLFWPRAAAYARGEGARDYKSSLQELSTRALGRVPQYRVEERGPAHEKEFTATVMLGGQEYGRGTGRSKKEAEQQAAREAFHRLAEASPPGPGGATTVELAEER